MAKIRPKRRGKYIIGQATNKGTIQTSHLAMDLAAMARDGPPSRSMLQESRDEGRIGNQGVKSDVGGLWSTVQTIAAPDTKGIRPPSGPRPGPFA